MRGSQIVINLDARQGSFRPTLIPHPLMRVHGRVWLQTVKPEIDGVLGGIGYGACITGRADNQVALARLFNHG